MSGAVAMALLLGGSAGMAAPTPGLGSTSLSPLELMSATKVPLEARADDSASPAPAQVFVYDLPESFHTGQLAASASLTAAAKLEHRLHTLFRTSRNRAANSSAATMFYVPVYPVATCEGLGKSSGCSEGLALVESAIAYIRSSAPHWDRYDGANHIIAAVGDHGSSVLPEDDLLTRPKTLGKAILLTPRVAPRALYEQSTVLDFDRTWNQTLIPREPSCDTPAPAPQEVAAPGSSYARVSSPPPRTLIWPRLHADPQRSWRGMRRHCPRSTTSSSHRGALFRLTDKLSAAALTVATCSSRRSLPAASR